MRVPMRVAIVLGLLAFGSSRQALAHYYNETFDCGKGQTVWIANPAVWEGGERRRKTIFEITLSEFDFESNDVVRSPVVRWDVRKDKVTLDGRPCRQLSEDELEERKRKNEPPGGDK